MMIGYAWLSIFWRSYFRRALNLRSNLNKSRTTILPSSDAHQRILFPTNILTFHLTFYLTVSDILYDTSSGILADIYSEVSILHSLWQWILFYICYFWHARWHMILHDVCWHILPSQKVPIWHKVCDLPFCLIVFCLLTISTWGKKRKRCGMYQI